LGQIPGQHFDIEKIRTDPAGSWKKMCSKLYGELFEAAVASAKFVSPCGKMNMSKSLRPLLPAGIEKLSVMLSKVPFPLTSRLVWERWECSAGGGVRVVLSRLGCEG